MAKVRANERAQSHVWHIRVSGGEFDALVGGFADGIVTR